MEKTWVRSARALPARPTRPTRAKIHKRRRILQIPFMSGSARTGPPHYTACRRDGFKGTTGKLCRPVVVVRPVAQRLPLLHRISRSDDPRRVRSTASRGSHAMQIQEFLTMMIEKGGSDANLKVGMPPGIRINGKITPIGETALTGADTETIAKQLLDAEKWQKFEYCGDLDTSYSVPGVARFRLNVMKQRGAISICLLYTSDAADERS